MPAAERSYEEADRLYEELKHILNHVGLAQHHVLDKNFYMDMNISVAGVAHQAGTCWFGNDPSTSVLDDDHPNKCRSRSDVIATFDRLLGEGVDGEVAETIVGPNGVAVALHVEWPNPGDGRGINFYQTYVVRDGLVTEIQRHDDRLPALAALSD